MRIFRFLDSAAWPCLLHRPRRRFAMPGPRPGDHHPDCAAAAIWAMVAPYLFTTVSAAVVAVLGWLAELFRRWTGIQIEARHREALHRQP